jgi:hypothetical protein
MHSDTIPNTIPNTIPYACGEHVAERTAARVSPLARAALDNGVSFDDVQAYCEGHNNARMSARFYETFVSLAGEPGGLLESERVECKLDGALARSFLAQTDGSIAAARVWWFGVLS